MEPSMTAFTNHNSAEAKFENTRDALLHATCATLEGVGFRQSAWFDDVFEKLNRAFDACEVAELQPRFVIVQLLKAINAQDPADDRSTLLSLIADEVILPVEAAHNVQA